MRGFLAGFMVGLVIVPLLAAVYFFGGFVPVAATDDPMPLEKRVANTSLHARLRREAPQRDVSTFTTADQLAGADLYMKNCAYCHGLPKQPAPPSANGMYPHAPQLFTADGTVTDDPVGVTFWKVQNGIRLTGMPSFKASLTDQQMWQVAAIPALADKLPAEVLDALKPQTTAEAPASHPVASSKPRR
jgi:thiosulfate dehydrogenase